MAQYCLISQQVIGGMLRTATVAGFSPGLGEAPIERILLQGAIALLACSAVHQV